MAVRSAERAAETLASSRYPARRRWTLSHVMGVPRAPAAGAPCFLPFPAIGPEQKRIANQLDRRNGKAKARAGAGLPIWAQRVPRRNALREARRAAAQEFPL